MTRQHNKTPEIIRLRILTSLVSWPRLSWSPGLLLPFMMTYALPSTLALECGSLLPLLSCELARASPVRVPL